MQRSRENIVLTNISFHAGGRPILQNVSWAIKPGQHWAVLGPNGSGKTTLLRIIAGYLWPQEGSVRVMGELYGETDLPSLRKRMGWVTSFLKRQLRGWETALEATLGGFEASIGIYRAFDETEISQAEETLGRLNIAHLANRRFDTLSQGERQRVLLARGLVHQPSLLILDEPCSGLDPLATRRFLDDLAAIAAERQDLSLLYVTHHLEEITPIIRHGILLREGRIIKAGAIENLLTSECVGAAFGAPCDILRQNGRFQIAWA